MQLNSSSNGSEISDVIADRYQPVKILGKSAIGQSILANDLAIQGSSVVLKVLHPHLAADPQIFKALQNTILSARQLSHQNIVRIYDFDRLSNEQCYITMEYIEGCNLAELITAQRKGIIPHTVAAKIIYDLSQALSYAHCKGVIHSGIKPENILISSNGITKLTDFGLATSLNIEGGFTVTGQLASLPQYMAPEEFQQGIHSEKSDIYSLGLILFEMMTGRPPFDADKYIDIGMAHITNAIPNLAEKQPDTPLWLSELFECCVAKQPEDRFETAVDIQEEILDHPDDWQTEDSIVEIKIPGARVGQLFLSNKVILAFAVILFCVGIPWLIAQEDIRRIAGINLLRFERTYQVESPILRSIFSVEGSLTNPDSVFTLMNKNKMQAALTLIKAGIPLNSKNQDGKPLLHIIAEKWTTSGVNSMHQRGADLNIEDEQGNTAIFFANFHDNSTLNNLDKLLKFGANINHQNKKGNTALHTAATQDAKRVQALLEKNINTHIRNFQGRTALMEAIANYSSIDSLQYTVNSLISHSATLHPRDDQGMSALLLATAQGLTPIVKQLLSAGANPDDNNLAGQSLYDLAVQTKNQELIEFVTEIQKNDAD